MSGVASRGLVLKNAPEVPAAIVSEPLRNSAYCSAGQHAAERIVDDVVERDRLRAAHHDADLHVVLQIVADARRIEHDIDAVLAAAVRRGRRRRAAAVAAS